MLGKISPRWAPGLLVLISLATRLPSLNSSPLWYDEIFSANLARAPMAAFWAAVRGDVHPPGYYLLLRPIAFLFGTSEWAMRLPSLLASVGCVVLLYGLARALRLGPRAALWAGMLAALLPGPLYFSSEARMYALLSLVVLGMALATAYRWWIALGVLGAAAAYLHNVGAIYAAVALAAGLVAHRRVKGPVLAGVLMLGLYLPWLPNALAQAREVGRAYWIQTPNPGGLLMPVGEMWFGQRWPPALVLAPYALALALLLAGLFASRRWLATKGGAVVLALGLGVPVALALISLNWQSLWASRLMLPSALLLLMPVAYSLSSINLSSRRALQAATLPVLALGLHFFYQPGEWSRFNLRVFLQPVLAGWQQEDAVYVASYDLALGVREWIQGADVLSFNYYSDLSQSLTIGTRAALDIRHAAPVQMAARYRRIWFVDMENPLMSDEQDQIRALVLSWPGTLIREWARPQNAYRLYLMEPQGASTGNAQSQ